MQLYADMRERQMAMEAAVAAEDYAAAAAERDAVDALMLRRRCLEIAGSAEARKVKFRPGARLAPAAHPVSPSSRLGATM